MGKLLAGIVIGIALVMAGGYLFVTEGGMPVATHSPPLPLERYLAGRALRAAVAGDANRPSPLPADETNLLAGAKVYRANCELCHGVLDAPRSAIARGMFPPPPQLLTPSQGVTDDPVGVTHWKVKNGIRLTGMPSFEGTLSDAQTWQVSLLLMKANQLPSSVKAALR